MSTMKQFIWPSKIKFLKHGQWMNFINYRWSCWKDPKQVLQVFVIWKQDYELFFWFQLVACMVSFLFDGLLILVICDDFAVRFTVYQRCFRTLLNIKVGLFMKIINSDSFVHGKKYSLAECKSHQYC